MSSRPKKKAAVKKSVRGTLRSLRNSDGYRAFVLEQLSGVKGLFARPMFGGIGLYADDTFFGIVASDTLYLKTNDKTRGAYETAGMTAFKPSDTKPMTMPYYQVPLNVLEDASELVKWAARAIESAGSTRRTRSVRRPRRTRHD